MFRLSWLHRLKKVKKIKKQYLVLFFEFLVFIKIKNMLKIEKILLIIQHIFYVEIIDSKKKVKFLL